MKHVNYKYTQYLYTEYVCARLDHVHHSVIKTVSVPTGAMQMVSALIVMIFY